MKTASGYTTKKEAQEHGKYVVWYRQQPAGPTYYVPFTRKDRAIAFLKAHGSGDGPMSPRSCGFA